MLEEKMRDAYTELRRSAYDLGATDVTTDDGGIKIRSPSLGGFPEDGRAASLTRKATLMENGMIVERVDIRKDESRMKRDERRSRKASRDSLAMLDGRERDAMSLYSLQAVEGAASIRSPAPYDSTTSVPLPTNRSVRSMYTIPTASWQQPANRPFSMANPGFASQTSLATTASPRRRYFGGIRLLSGYFGSSPSLAQSGSMVDMQYVQFFFNSVSLVADVLSSIGLDQEKHLPRSPERPSLSPQMERDGWPRMEDVEMGRRSLDTSFTLNGTKKKKRGLSRLWRILTGPGKSESSPYANHQVRSPEDDLPLAPPPPLSYLVNRGSLQSERNVNMLSSGGRHLSMPSLSNGNTHHPRSNSIRSAIGISLSSPSDQSSTLPSPTEVRFPQRDHVPEMPDDGIYDHEGEGISRKRSTGYEVRVQLYSFFVTDIIRSTDFFVSFTFTAPDEATNVSVLAAGTNYQTSFVCSPY